MKPNKRILMFSGMVIMALLLFAWHNQGSCEVRNIQKLVQGDSMEPYIQNGETLILREDYYKICGETPQVGDIVAHRYGGDPYPLIKVIRATHTDTVKLLGNSLIINGEVLVNSAGERYVFTPGEAALLSLYIRNGHIPEKSYLLFGDNVKNSVDSRKF